jgi:DDE superfamily endonuclease
MLDVVFRFTLRPRRAIKSRRCRLLMLLASMNSGTKELFRHKLNREGLDRRNRNLKRKSLLDPGNAPWSKLYESKDNAALITVTGFDHDAFQLILELFQPLFHEYTPWTRKQDGRRYKRVKSTNGRKRMIDAKDCLGLVLAWFRFKGAQWILQGWFGLTGAQTNVWLRFGRRMLFRALKQHPDCVVRYPNESQIARLMEAITDRHPCLEKVYCVADGLKLQFQACADLTEQSMFYNGWQHGHYITNLFVFAADGRIIDAVVNIPGSVHDSTIAIWGGTYGRLKDVYRKTGGICCVDSAFAAGNAPYLIRSAQDVNMAKSAKEMAIMKEATSLRQAAEWGMRAIQGSMPRLTETIKYETNGERKLVMKLVPLLYNLRLAKVGLNQLANTYVPSWSKDSAYYIKSKAPRIITP